MVQHGLRLLGLDAMFRKILTSGVLLAGLSGAALAADLPSHAPPPVYVPPPPVFSWTGFYAGIAGGIGLGRTDHFDFTPGGVAPHDVNGPLVGGEAGYDYQLGPLVVGVLADADYTNINGSATCPNPADVCQTRNNFLGSVRGKVGVAFNQFLVFGTGGVGFEDTRYNEIVNATGANVGTPQTIFKTGFTAGGGLAYQVAPGWAIKAEYVYYGFGSTNFAAGTLDPASAVSVRTNIHTVRFGFDYIFNAPPPPPPPIIAKY
jgi:outer membrane immunogenic protein